MILHCIAYYTLQGVMLCIFVQKLLHKLGRCFRPPRNNILNVVAERVEKADQTFCIAVFQLWESGPEHHQAFHRVRTSIVGHSAVDVMNRLIV